MGAKKNKKMGKIIIGFLLIGMLSSCFITFNKLPHYEQTFIMDFSEFAKKDFHFTTDIYRGKYISYGFISEDLFPEVKTIARSAMGIYDTIKYIKKDNILIERIAYDDILRKIYKKATALGADAFVDFKLKYISNPKQKYGDWIRYEPGIIINGYGYTITGLAIKRLD